MHLSTKWLKPMSLTRQQLQAEAKYGQPELLLSIWSFDVCDFIQIIEVLVCIEATKDNSHQAAQPADVLHLCLCKNRRPGNTGLEGADTSIPLKILDGFSTKKKTSIDITNCKKQSEPAQVFISLHVHGIFLEMIFMPSLVLLGVT